FYEIRREAETVKEQLAAIRATADVPRQRAAIADLERDVAREDLWEDPAQAQQLMTQLTELKDGVREVEEFADKVEEVCLIVELLETEQTPDASLVAEAREGLQWVRGHMERYAVAQLLSGQFDRKGARLTIAAGAGGTDAQVRLGVMEWSAVGCGGRDEGHIKIYAVAQLLAGRFVRKGARLTIAAGAGGMDAQLAADKSAVNWHSFIGSIRRVLSDAWVPPYRVLDVILRRPHALPPTAPDHPGETPPLPPSPGDPPREPDLQLTVDQATADADFILRRRAYLIRKAEYDAAVEAYDQAVAGRNAHLAVVAKYNDDLATFTPNLIDWTAADTRACTVLLGALFDSLMRRFQARELRASVIWAELHAMFERRDIGSVGILFQEYFSITLATCDGAVDYVGRMREVADRFEARQAGLSEPLQIHRQSNGRSRLR
ncbi:unnamed protein product, partial [Closterium sp. NIES-64]